MKQNSLKLIRSYLRDPQPFWGTQTRQADKLRRRVRFVATKCGIKENHAIEEIAAVAQLRHRRRRRSIYISNIGSSGSHWLEYMLASLGNLLPVGEVYVPSAFWKRLEDVPSDERQMCLDAVYVAHCGTLDDQVLRAGMMNSAHLADLSHFTAVDKHAQRVLLVRNPVDVVMSRTFRKDEYRAFIDGSATDQEYFDRNVATVRGFFEKAKLESFTFTLRYEDLVNSGTRALGDLAAALEIDVTDAMLHAAVSNNREGVAPEVAALGRTSNRVQAEPKDDAARYRQAAERILAPLLQDLGYETSMA